MRTWVIGATVLVIAGGALVGQDVPAPEKANGKRIPAGTMIQKVIIEACFVRGPMAKMKQLGLDFDGKSKTISSKDWAGLIREVRHLREVELLNTPKLTMISGQRAYIAMTSHTNYVRDCLPGKDPAKMTPVIGTVAEGLVLDVRATVGAKGEVIFRYVSPATSVLLGMRECKATVEVEGKQQKVSWQEPVTLVGRPRFENPCEIRVKAGGALVVPLDYVVEQGAGAARAFAVNGKVNETYKAAAKAKKEEPTGRIIACVLTTRVLDPVPTERDMELPGFRGPTWTFELQPGKVKREENGIFEPWPDKVEPPAVKSSVRGTQPKPIEPK